jgi:polyisoprenoid-binding protein YceI
MPALRHPLLAVVLALASATALATPQRYSIVSKLSRVGFGLDHQGFISLMGTVRMAPGSFVFDAENWSRSDIQVSMPIASIDLGDATWNNQVRGDSAWSKLFRGASIEFRSTRLEQLDATNGRMHGELTLAGVTRPVVLQMRFNKLAPNRISKKLSVGFSASTAIRRSDFGLDAYLDLVGDEMAIRIQIEGVEGEDGDASNTIDALGVTAKP